MVCEKIDKVHSSKKIMNSSDVEVKKNRLTVGPGETKKIIGGLGSIIVMPNSQFWGYMGEELSTLIYFSYHLQT